MAKKKASDLVDCMVALPGQLFYSTQIPVCLWFLTKSKKADAKRGYRDRRKQTLFIDARKLGTLIDRVHRELTDADLEKITSTYHAWRGDSSTKNKEPGTKNPTAAYADVAGFCKSATTAEIAAHGHVLTPGRYVGAEEIEDDGDPFEEKMPRLVTELHAQFAGVRETGAGHQTQPGGPRLCPLIADKKKPRDLSVSSG